MKKIKYILALTLVISLFACSKDDNNDDLSIYVTPTVATLTTGNVSNITAFTAKVAGNITTDGNSTLTACGVVYGESANPTITDAITICDTLKGAFIATLSKLKFETTYHVRAYAINKLGVSYGNDVTFKTGSPDYTPFIGAALEYDPIKGKTSTVNISLGSEPNTLIIDKPAADAFVRLGIGKSYSGSHPIKIKVNPDYSITVVKQLWMDSFLDPTEMGPLSIYSQSSANGGVYFADKGFVIDWVFAGNAYWGADGDVGEFEYIMK